VTHERKVVAMVYGGGFVHDVKLVLVKHHCFDLEMCYEAGRREDGSWDIVESLTVAFSKLGVTLIELTPMALEIAGLTGKPFVKNL
jgi:hypothetical protein